MQHQAQTSDFPLMIEVEKAEGIYMYGSDGHRYIDLISGIGVSNVGHRHPKVLRAIHDQLDRYMHLMVYGEFVQGPQAQLAQALCSTLPPRLNNVYLLNSGTEAVEGAMKLAKRYTGRTGFVTCRNAYHGSTQGALSVNGSEGFKNAFRPLLPDVRVINHGAIPDLQQITEHTAAIIIEAVQGEAGLRVPEASYMQALRDRCTEVGALLILDEIQTGFGRTGTFWAFEQFGIEPDILLCAKGMGGGMPIGAFIAPQEIMAVFKNDPILGHLTTFGGHPVSCAASLATLQTIQEENLLAGVEEKANLFRELLVHPRIKGIRNKGLMMAAEFESFEVLKAVIDQAIVNGVLTDWFLFCDNSMRIAPPLIITEEQIHEACQIILRSIDEALA